MREIALTKGYVTLVDDEDFERFGMLKWQSLVPPRGTTIYAKRTSNASGWRHAIYLHREIMQAPQGMWVDHRDRDGLNNRRENLRICTPSQNQGNSAHRRSRMRFKGIRLANGAYQAQVAGRYLGSFRTQEEAARAYDVAALERWNTFARTNFQS